MSSVTIPSEVGAGQVHCELQLTKDDARQFVDRLKVAVERLIAHRQNGGAAGPPQAAAPPAAAAAHPPPATAPVTPAPAAPRSSVVAAPASTATPPPARAPPPLFPGAVPATAPLPRPAPALAPAAAAQRATPAAAAPQQHVPSTGQPAHAAAAAASGPSWQLCWTTDSADHNGDVVSSMAYVPQIQGLPGGDGHAGWLVSASRGLLNLWEASPSGGRGEPALMCMHSQGTDYSAVCLDADRSTRMLLAASQDRGGKEWVTCHSLEVDTLLGPKGRCPMPHNQASSAQGQNCLTVASLNSFGGPLTETVVSSYGGALVVWPVGNATRPAATNASQPGETAPRALWKAHTVLITALHKSPYSLALFSGDAAGKVHMYDMREKPNQPLAQFAHQGRVTGIHQVNDSQLLTTAGDGRLMVWDIRGGGGAGPVKFAVPDTKPIVRMAVSPFADSVAVATTAGIHMVDLIDSACHSTVVLPAIKSPVTALQWNTATSEVVAAGGAGPAGTISVFKARLPGY